MRSRRSLLIGGAVSAILTVSSLAWSVAPPEQEAFTRPIRYVGPSLPDINIVPAHLPVPGTSTGIGTGSQILMDRPDGSFLCTANFIWKSGTTTYLGAAGHCFVPADLSTTHGIDADYDASLTTVYVCVSDCEFGGQIGAVWGNFSKLGNLAYARQDRNGVALGEDFGIVEIPTDLLDDVRTSMPIWGGPSSLEDVTTGKGVCVYGNAAGFGESYPTKARMGIGEGISENKRYWKAALPSFQGDSGSGLITCGQDEEGLHGEGAAGILTHIGLGSHPGRILGTTMGQAADMTLRDAGISIQAILEDGSAVSPPPPPPPPPAPPAPPADGTVGIGNSYSWSAGPFTRTAPLVESVLFGDDCDSTDDEGDHCDYQYVQVNVPSGGAILKVTVTAGKEDSDFDLYVFRPDGSELGSSTKSATPPEVVEQKVTHPGVYTIAVNPWSTTNDSYSATVQLLAPPPTPTVSPVTGVPHMYVGGAVDPFLAGGYVLAPGVQANLSVRTIKSSSDSITLTVSPTPNFTGMHRVMRDGQVVYGPFETTERADGAAFRTDSTWVVPSNAAAGTYVFEAFLTINGTTYQTASLEFEVL